MITAQTMADYIVTRWGFPKNEQQLKDMLIHAYTRGNIDGVLNGQAVIDNVIAKLRRQA
jgi:hypothetical protein